MARLIGDVVKEMFYEPPKRPVTERFAYEHHVDPRDIEMMRNREHYARNLKRQMAHELAEHIIDKCQLFQIPEMRDLLRGVPIRMELTINDRGAYENWIPGERREAHANGLKMGAERIKRSMPYGFELEQYYE